MIIAFYSIELFRLNSRLCNDLRFDTYEYDSSQISHWVYYIICYRKIIDYSSNIYKLKKIQEIICNSTHFLFAILGNKHTILNSELQNMFHFPV